jgi:hypothetical protein
MPVDEGEPDNDIERKFILAFKGTMKQSHLNILLNGGFDVTALDLDLAGLDGEAL